MCTHNDLFIASVTLSQDKVDDCVCKHIYDSCVHRIKLLVASLSLNRALNLSMEDQDK